MGCKNCFNECNTGCNLSLLNFDLHQAVKQDDVETAKKLLEKGANPNAPDISCSWAPLCEACSMKMVLLLLKLGADVNSKDLLDQSVLHHAVFNRKEEIVKTLLENGADVNARDDLNQTPLDYAKKKKNQEIIALLENRSVKT